MALQISTSLRYSSSVISEALLSLMCSENPIDFSQVWLNGRQWVSWGIEAWKHSWICQFMPLIIRTAEVGDRDNKEFHEYYNSKTHSMLKQIEAKLYSQKHHSAPDHLREPNSLEETDSKMTLSQYIDQSSTNIQQIRHRLKMMNSKQKLGVSDMTLQDGTAPNLEKKIQILEGEKKQLKDRVRQLQDQLVKEKCTAELEMKVKLQNQQINYLNRCNKIQQEQLQKLRGVIAKLSKQSHSERNIKEGGALYETPSKKTISKLKNIQLEVVRLPTQGPIPTVNKKKHEGFGRGKYGSMYLKRNYAI